MSEPFIQSILERFSKEFILLVEVSKWLAWRIMAVIHKSLQVLLFLRQN